MAEVGPGLAFGVVLPIRLGHIASSPIHGPPVRERRLGLGSGGAFVPDFVSAKHPVYSSATLQVTARKM